MSNDNTKLQLNMLDSAYLYKKTEKLVSAIYLLSNFLSDKEPLKWQLREAGLKLLSPTLTVSDRLSAEAHCLSLLEVLFIGGLISEMNYNILKFEFENMIQIGGFGEKQAESKGLIFPDHFFEIPESPKDNSLALGGVSLGTSKAVSLMADKGQNKMSDRPKPVKSSYSGEIKTERPSAAGRQEVIIGLLKKNPGLGIKDFTSAVKGCSEKTIQRELAALVSKGLIKKEGEKRWSRYSLE